MNRTKIVLHNNDQDEIELGPFNQGVVIEGPNVIDVASGDRVAFINTNEKRVYLEAGWGRGNLDRQTSPQRPYRQLFIHAVPA